MPFVIDDLDFMQSGLAEGIVLALSHQYETLILSGFERTTTNGGLQNNIGAGYIFHKGKIYRFDGGSFGATYPHLQPSIEELSEGNKMYEDQTTKATYVEDVVTISQTSTAESIPVSELEDYRFGIAKQGVLLSQNHYGSKLRYHKRGSMVNIYGYIAYKAADPTLVLELPPHLISPVNIRFDCRGLTDKEFRLSVSSAGLVNVYCDAPANDRLAVNITYIVE